MAGIYFYADGLRSLRGRFEHACIAAPPAATTNTEENAVSTVIAEGTGLGQAETERAYGIIQHGMFVKEYEDDKVIWTDSNGQSFWVVFREPTLPGVSLCCCQGVDDGYFRGRATLQILKTLILQVGKK